MADLSCGFTPQILAAIARVQAPEYPWLPHALEDCGAGAWESAAYVRYISAQNAHAAGAEWQFETNVVLEHPHFGTVIVDVLTGHRIGGLEFLSRI
ncbi:hypothetical protein [Pseudoduganella sp. R-34]|uniref:hypothetical protein n=1 Tax=unclassified Pseudoduganella TaxID=2637179 RepID=UPI003CF4BC5A